MTSKHVAQPQSNPQVHPKYRPDIDGLRAIAVLCVVGFHAFPEKLKGGFIGVDIFFVISGYLISTIIFENLARDTFSFSDFYLRRVRRIFPALLLVLTTCFVFGWFTLYPDEYKQLAKHIAAGAGFVSNLVFWQESGYFDNVADTKPLLHLWSLGIEEQFYIVWPLLLWLAWKKKLDLLPLTLGIAVISFVLNLNQMRTDVVADFYSPQTRFWELLAGSILAHFALARQSRCNPSKHRFPAWLSNLLHAPSHPNVRSFSGAALMVLGLLLIDKSRAFPGWWAVLPTAAAVLMIAAGPQAWFNRIVLSNRLLVWFGLISFPLYLWHWPLLSFLRIVADGKPTHTAVLAAVFIAIALAGLTYQWLEKPLRLGTTRKFTARILIAGVTATGIAGGVTYQLDGLPLRTTSNLAIAHEGDVGHDSFHDHKKQLINLCAQYVQTPVPCFQSDRNKLTKIAVIGDSHADHIALGLAEQLPASNIVFFDALGLPLFSSKEGATLLRFIMADPQINSVILSASWYARLGSVPATSSLEAELLQVVVALTGVNKKTYLVDDVPNFSFPPQKCRYQGNWLRANQCSENSTYFFDQYRQYFPALQAVKNKSNAEIIKIADYFCSNDSCSMEKNGSLMYRDNNHLNLNGSNYVAQQMLRQLPQLATRPNADAPV